jgi:hypothetical protein
VTGNLFQQEGALLFVPAGAGEQAGSWAGRFRFLWDVNRQKGYVLSEALRGFTSISLPSRDNRAITTPPGTGDLTFASIDGRQCVVHELTVPAKQRQGRLTLWRADPAEPPVQIRTDVTGPSVTIQLRRLAVDRLSPELFSIPAGFSRYDSVERMISELLHKPRPLPYTTRSEWRPSRIPKQRAWHTTQRY